MAGRSAIYRLSPLARADLEDIWLYTRDRWSTAQADRYLRDVVATFEGLAKGDLVGRRVEVRAGYLKYPVGSHFVFYRDAPEGVDVVRVLHQHMDIPSRL